MLSEHSTGRRKLGVTLFEDQLLRYYLIADEGQFFRTLSSSFDVTIFTNELLFNKLRSQILSYGLGGIEIVIFRSIPDRGIAQIPSFLLNWSLPSGSTLVKLNRKSSIPQLIGRLVRRFLGGSCRLRNILRSVYKLCFSNHQLLNGFQCCPEELDALFITSLTNNYEDVRVGTFYRKSKETLIVGTVRSWDNLTSHGCLRLIPDLFLSHSQFITDKFINLQLLDGVAICEWQVPAYMTSYPNRARQDNRVLNRDRFFTYASMGLTTNPDDQNMILWLVNNWSSMPANYRLTILQHPKFIVDVDLSFDNVDVIRFDYLNSSPANYYAFLSAQDLVLCGGTSVIMDCLFTNTPVVLMNFEIISQPYWRSALRYFDTMDHTLDLISRLDYCLASSPKQLMSILKSSCHRTVDPEEAEFFTGSRSFDPAEKLVCEVTSILDTRHRST